ncbi:MAG TPA: OmpA family protein [Anditalea sp.]|nr:OmpA family protein [Anditalea sp.]
MKKIYLLLFILSLSTGFSSDILAQNAAIRYGDRQFELLNYKEAAEVYVKAYERKPTYYAALRAAKSFENIRDYQSSYEWWRIVADFEESTQDDRRAFAQAAQQVGNTEEYIQIKNRNGMGNEVEEAIIRRLSSQQTASITPIDSLNSRFADFGLALDNQGNKYITSDRGEFGDGKASRRPFIRIDGRNKFDRDVYGWTGRDFLSVYRVDDGGFTEVKSPVPNTYNFSDPFFLKEQPIVFYTVTRERKKVKQREFSIHPEIYFSSVNESGEFTDYNPFPYNSFLDHSVITPFVDEENMRVYFASDMAGGQGGLDLYYVTYDDEFNFGEPVNLGPDVNSPGHERNPYRVEDRFYFSSDGHTGLGGLDVFRADMLADRISNVTNMGAPYNSPQDDYAFSLIEKGQAVLSSDRMGGTGIDDIYLIEEMFRRFRARVLDCDGNLIRDDLNFTLENVDRRSMVDVDRGSEGEVTADLEVETGYVVNIEKQGYFTKRDTTLTTKGFDGEMIEREYRLAKIPYEMPVFVDLMYYDLDKSEIREEAKPTLNKLAELMKTYSFLDLMVRSHTDSRASDKYNEKLSNRRADAVVEYLNGQGINSERISAEWFGEEELVNDCVDGRRCPETEHQLNRRSELVLKAFTDTGKQYELPVGFDECDDLIENLRSQLTDKGLVVLPKVYFDFDRANLRTEHKMALERLAVMMKNREDFKLSLEGHTDIRGSEEYNKSLSERRAKSVLNYLLDRGVSQERLTYEWFGKSRPVNDCISCTAAQHQENRRTEIKMINE